MRARLRIALSLLLFLGIIVPPLLCQAFVGETDRQLREQSLAPSPSVVESQKLCPAAPVRTTVDPAHPLIGRTIVVDPGHGGLDSGAIRSGVMEKDLNLAIALKLKAELEARGARVVMTRTTDTTVSKETRVESTNQVCPDAFVSVHVNAMAAKQAPDNGVEVYYYANASKPLAKVLKDSLVAGLPAVDRGVRWDELFVIHHTSVPAVLVEIGYLSHAGERAKLVTGAYQDRAARAIAEGVEQYFTP
jgi:N-acetylmuramoyl-L-alanine amidase